MQLHNVLLGPVVTEKAVRLQEANKHMFRVHSDATKVDVINALRAFYNVTPRNVHIIKSPKKIRMIGRSRIFTKRKATKKALVTLASGQTIELVNVKKAKEKKAVPDKEQKKSSSNSKKK